jgi:hypothetical protein
MRLMEDPLALQQETDFEKSESPLGRLEILQSGRRIPRAAS